MTLHLQLNYGNTSTSALMNGTEYWNGLPFYWI